MKENNKYLQKIMVLFMILALGIISVPTTPTKAQSMNYLMAAVNTQKQIGFPDSIMSLAIGDSKPISFINNGKTVSYRVGDTSIATIDKLGKVTGKTQGRTFVYATCNGRVYRSIIAVYQVRISASETTKKINQEDVLYATLKNRKEKENLLYEVANPSILGVKIGSFSGDKVTIQLIPKKLGTTTLTLKRSNSVEELKIKITVIEKKELSAVDIYKKCSPAMVEIHVKTADGGEGLGSGFFVEKDKILTNYHVIEGAVSITCIDYNGNEYPAQFLYDYDKEFDLALLGVNANHKAVVVSYAPVVTGERIFTIGSPYGLTGTLSTGLISKAYRTLDTDIIYTQITASISRGNSGGPLINRFGEVIGVNSLTRSEGQNLNFSVPITYLLNLNVSSPGEISEFYKGNQ